MAAPMRMNGSRLGARRVASALLLLATVFAAAPSSQTPPRRDDLVINFDDVGLWTVIGGAHTRLLGTSPDQIAVADADGNGVDDIACEFGAGLWTFFNNSFWRLENTDDGNIGFPVTLLTYADLNGNGVLYYVIDIYRYTYGVVPLTFPSPVYKLLTSRHGALSAVKGHVNHPLSSPGDDLILNYNDGIWIRSPYLASLVQLHPQPAQAMAVADFDAPGQVGHNVEDVAISFANGLGTWIYRTNLAWIQVHPLSAVQMAAGDLDGDGVADLVLDFGPGNGIWIYSNLTSWRRLHSSSSRHIVLADLDGDGVKDIVVDFGPGAGIWVFQNNQSWYQLTARSAKQIAVAHLE